MYVEEGERVVMGVDDVGNVVVDKSVRRGGEGGDVEEMKVMGVLGWGLGWVENGVDIGGLVEEISVWVRVVWLVVVLGG